MVNIRNCHSDQLPDPGGRSAGRTWGRSAKFELILTTRCQYHGGGVDLLNLNSS